MSGCEDHILMRSPKSFRRAARIKAAKLNLSTPKYLERLAMELEGDVKKEKKKDYNDFFKI